MIETLDDLRASGDYQVFQAAEEDDSVIAQIIFAQRAELEQEIASLETEAERGRFLFPKNPRLLYGYSAHIVGACWQFG